MGARSAVAPAADRPDRDHRSSPRPAPGAGRPPRLPVRDRVALPVERPPAQPRPTAEELDLRAMVIEAPARSRPPADPRGLLIRDRRLGPVVLGAGQGRADRDGEDADDDAE